MPATRLKIFISSVKKEFTDIRRDLKASNSMPFKMKQRQTVLPIHLKNGGCGIIFPENDLIEFSVVKEYFTPRSDNKNYKTKFYSLRKAGIYPGYWTDSELSSNKDEYNGMTEVEIKNEEK